MKASEKKIINLRIMTVAAFFAVFFSIIAARAVYLQVFCRPDLSLKAISQYERFFTSSGRRGTIYDIRGREMAVTVDDIKSVGAHPSDISDPAATADALAAKLDMDPRTLRKKLRSSSSFIWIKRQLTPRETKDIRELNIDGIAFIQTHKRFYPNGMLAAQLLGFTGIDGQGLEGLESYYGRFLRGSKSRFRVLRDALGRKIFGTREIEDGESGGKKMLVELAKDYSGNSLVLTIDRSIQFIAENALRETVIKFSAKSGMSIVMEPKTGAILALAHFPLFNPNVFSNFDRNHWRNRAVTDPFEPGSTMKIFSAAAAISSGSCTPDTIFFCEKGAYQIGEDVIHDTSPYGWLSLSSIIKHSSNIGIVKTAETIGAKALHHTLSRFGFGKKTGIDCPGETSGTLSHHKRWSKIDEGAIAFGQGISASAIQLVSAVSALANDGQLMRPYVVQAITDQEGHPVQTFAPVKVRQAVSAKTAKAVKKMMRAVVEGGTGVKAALKGYAVCGKTGTAQKINREKGAYAEGRYVSSFVGIVPEEKPRLAIVVIIDEPREEHYGGVVAAPVFRKIAHEVLNYINIPPQRGNDKLTVSLEEWING